jgi:MoaA/NifB/PqqE/SkfB family radical SAM enzyme
MNSLTTISGASSPILANQSEISAHHISALPIVVIAPHNQCNCRCVMCDIWRIRESQQITPADLERQISSFRDLGVRWAVFTGGEPQLNPKLFTLARMLRSEGIRVTLLTAGLLLESQAEEVAATIDDVIVSLDGPPPIHNHIRRVPDAFERIAAGVKALRQLRPDISISARCTVQKENHQSLHATAAAAREIGLNSISYLAADLTSPAFNRSEGWSPERQERVALNAAEVEDLNIEIENIIREYKTGCDSGFVVESPAKLRRIVQHFRAHLAQAEHVAPRCNAPWVSAVVEASGDVRPCFFHPAIGNINQGTLREIVNSPAAVRFRSTLDVATNPVCRSCVCSLHIPRESLSDPAHASTV